VGKVNVKGSVDVVEVLCPHFYFTASAAATSSWARLWVAAIYNRVGAERWWWWGWYRDGPALERGAGVECVERVGPVGGGAARFEGRLLLPSLDQPYSTCPKA